MGIFTQWLKDMGRAHRVRGFYGIGDDARVRLRKTVGAQSVWIVDVNILAFQIWWLDPETREHTTVGTLEDIVKALHQLVTEALRKNEARIVVAVADDQSRVWWMKRSTQKQRDLDQQPYAAGTTLDSVTGILRLPTGESTSTRISARRLMASRSLRLALWRAWVNNIRDHAHKLFPACDPSLAQYLVVDIERPTPDDPWCPVFRSGGVVAAVAHARLFGEADLQQFTWVRRMRKMPICLHTTDSDTFPLAMLYLSQVAAQEGKDEQRPLWWWRVPHESKPWYPQAVDLRKARPHLPLSPEAFLMVCIASKTDFVDPADWLPRGITMRNRWTKCVEDDALCRKIVARAAFLPYVRATETWRTLAHVDDPKTWMPVRHLLDQLTRRLLAFQLKVDEQTTWNELAKKCFKRKTLQVRAQEERHAALLQVALLIRYWTPPWHKMYTGKRKAVRLSPFPKSWDLL